MVLGTRSGTVTEVAGVSIQWNRQRTGSQYKCYLQRANSPRVQTLTFDLHHFSGPSELRDSHRAFCTCGSSSRTREDVVL